MAHSGKMLLLAVMMAGCSSESPTNLTVDEGSPVLLGAAESLPTADLDNSDVPIVSTDLFDNIAAVTVTQAEAPEVEAPQVEAPQVEAPQVEAPEVEAPEVEAPEVEVPETESAVDIMPEPVTVGQANLELETISETEQAPTLELVSESGSLAATKEVTVPAIASASADACEFPQQEATVQRSWSDNNSSSGALGYLESMTEQTGNIVTRVSSNSVWGVDNGKAIHQYSKRQAWNADETLIDIGERTVDANTLQIVNGYIPISSARNWSNVQPDIMYGIRFNPLPNEFVTANVRTGEVTVLRSFSDYTACTIGDFEGSLSANDERVMLACTHNSSGQRTLISYDIASNSVLGTIPAASNFNWGSFSPSGEFLLVENQRWPDPNPQLIRYNPDFSNPVVVSNETEHGDFGYDDNGDEVYAMLRWDVIFYIRLRDGKRVDMTVSGKDNAIGNGHLSCRNTARPGWCYITTDVSSKIAAIKISEQAPAAELWGFHRSGYQEYYAQPKGTTSRSGDKFLFSSHWYERGEINDYLLSCKAP